MSIRKMYSVEIYDIASFLKKEFRISSYLSIHIVRSCFYVLCPVSLFSLRSYASCENAFDLGVAVKNPIDERI